MDKYPRVLDLLPKAKKRLPHFASEYLFSGTGYDLAIKNNTEILKNIFLIPLTISLNKFYFPKHLSNLFFYQK